MLGTDDGILLVSADCELLGSTLGGAYGIKLGLDERTELSSRDVSFDGSNDVIPEVLLIANSFGSYDGTSLGSFYGAIDVLLEK